jgi:hypothetical protein
MITPVRLLGVAAGTALASCAVPPGAMPFESAQSSGPQCFLADEVNGYRAEPDGFYNVKVGADRWFRMQLSEDCPSMDWLMQIAIRPRDSNWLCEGENSHLIAPDPAGLHRRCLATGIQRLTVAEISSMQPPMGTAIAAKRSGG